MLKKLTAKVQQLNPNLSDSVTGFAHNIVIEPETQELVLKKGSLYIVFDISGNTQFEVSLITKVVQDVLHDSYYQSESISPIQSLEKAIAEVRDRVTQLANESIIIENQEIEFNIVAGALWGNVMYVVQYGDAKSYLMRTGDIRPISTTSEGNFSAASGVVKDEDVIIFSSHDFTDDFPPDKLLTVAIPESSLKPKQSCLLMKFVIDTTFTQNEVVDFGIEGIKPKKPSPKFLAKLTEKFKKPTVKAKKETPIREIGLKLKTPRKVKIKPQLIIGLILIAMGISIFFTVKNRNDKAKVTPQLPQERQVPTEVVSSEPVKTEELTDNNAFYDLKIVDANAQATQIAAFTDYVVVTDEASGKIYMSNRETPKFTELQDKYAGIKNVMNIRGLLGFTDNEGYKAMELKESTLETKFNSAQLGVTAAYSDFIYSISGDTLTRYTKEGTAYKGTLWGQNAEFAQVTSFGISYSIFLLKSDGEVIKYTTGEKDTFTISGVETPLNNPVQLVADVEFDRIYVADKGNQRVVALEKSGKFVKEYKAAEEGRWSDIKSIGVSPNEKTLYVLTGTRIYEVAL